MGTMGAWLTTQIGMGNPGAGPRWLAEARHESAF